MRLRIRGGCACVVLCAAAAAAAAAAQAIDEDELALVYGDKSFVSIATGEPQHARRAPAVATVITAQDIRAMGAADLDEVLETVPGLHVSQTPEYTPIYVIRGIRSARVGPHVLMLVNGIPMTGAFAGDRGNVWGGLPLENIARIEVMRSPGSALYGADAYAGVINIITKTAADIGGTQAGVRFGSFNTRNAWMQHGGSLGPFDVAAYFSVGRTDGPDGRVVADAQSRNDAAFGTVASLAPGSVRRGYDAIDAQLDLAFSKWRFRTAYKQRDDVGSGAGAGQALDSFGSSKSERFTADLGWHDRNFARDWDMSVQASFFHLVEHTSFMLFPPGTSFAPIGGGAFPSGMIGQPSRWERQARLAASGSYTGIDRHRIRIGAGRHKIDLYKVHHLRNYEIVPGPAGPVPAALGTMTDVSDTAPFMFPASRSVHYLYLQDEWSLAPDWTVTAGVRHDRYSDFGGTTNPRAALVWNVRHNLTAKLLYGRAFRAPSFAESRLINNPVATGNPRLKPEKIDTLELALDWQSVPDVQLGMSLYRYRMRDIIDFVPNAIPTTGATAQNTGARGGNGLELEAAWDVSKALRLSANHAYQRTTDKTSNRDAGGAPRHHTYFRSDWHFAQGWTANAQLNLVGTRMREPGDARTRLAGYRTLDLTLRKAGGYRRWGFAISARNLFDADAREPSPYATPAASIPNDLPLAGRAVFLWMDYAM